MTIAASGAWVESRDGAASEFDAFVVARGDALWRSAWLLTGDHQLAEDLVQTALAKAWPQWSRIGPGGFEAYVRRILFTTYAAWWRRRWNGERPTQELPETAVPGEQESTAGLEDLGRALRQLPKGQRAVVVLRYVDDLTEAQTAEALGVSIGTVKSQAARALKALRQSAYLREEEAR